MKVNRIRFISVETYSQSLWNHIEKIIQFLFSLSETQEIISSLRIPVVQSLLQVIAEGTKKILRPFLAFSNGNHSFEEYSNHMEKFLDIENGYKQLNLKPIEKEVILSNAKNSGFYKK